MITPSRHYGICFKELKEVQLWPHRKEKSPRLAGILAAAPHWKLSMPGIVKCPHCQQMKLSHRVCKHCGYYDGKEVVKMEEAANN